MWAILAFGLIGAVGLVIAFAWAGKGPEDSSPVSGLGTVAGQAGSQAGAVAVAKIASRVAPFAPAERVERGLADSRGVLFPSCSFTFQCLGPGLEP